MGIIELHFHDADFDFSPSMSTGGEAADEDESEDWSEDTEAGGWDDESGDNSDSSVGLGALVALVVLVALAAVAGLKRRNGGSDEDSAEDSDAVELEA